MDLKTITAHAAKFDAANSALREAVCIFEHDLQDVTKSHRRAIDGALKTLLAARRELAAQVDAARELFTNPKTLVLSGVKVGLRKDPDGVYVEDVEKTLAACKELFKGADSNPVVDVKESLVLTALRKLSPEEMELVGVIPSKGVDVVVVEPVEGDVEKLIAALVKEARKIASGKEA